jgi:hypothetical protein
MHSTAVLPYQNRGKQKDSGQICLGYKAYEYSWTGGWSEGCQSHVFLSIEKLCLAAEPRQEMIHPSEQQSSPILLSAIERFDSVNRKNAVPFRPELTYARSSSDFNKHLD